MHELGITRNIVSIVADHANGRAVKRVALDIGKLAGLDARSISFCFDIVAQGTVLEKAVLELNEIDGLGKCLSCEIEFAMPALIMSCACGSRDVERLAGEELKIREFEYSDEASQVLTNQAAC